MGGGGRRGRASHLAGQKGDRNARARGRPAGNNSTQQASPTCATHIRATKSRFRGRQAEGIPITTLTIGYRADPGDDGEGGGLGGG